jgi:type I restriction-modification system DNA methylase subunit
MALNHGHLIEALETAVAHTDPMRLAIEVLRAYQLPKATLTQLENGGDRNVGVRPGDIGVRRKLYFRCVESGNDLQAQAEALAGEEAVKRHKIRFVLVTDRRDVIAYDLQADDRLDCALADLPRQYTFFLPLAGYEKAQVHAESAADVKAAERIGRLIDLIRRENDLETPEDLHALNVFLTRLLFCFFAEDTGIFEPNQFTGVLKSTTADDASDIDTRIEEVFSVLAQRDRPASLPAHLASLPYVNGGLFKETMPVPAMGRRARRQLLNAGDLDWSAINPDIFGSMFQAVIDPEQRGSMGQHYTSVSNIMKVIRPLFIDKLEAELERSRGSRKRLERLLTRLQSIKIFDPACGSGNFLIIAYKELRRIEMAVFEAMDALAGGSEPIIPDEQDEMFAKPGQQTLAAPSGQKEIFMSGIRLSQLYGIEIDDSAHEIAQLSLWLAEHQMNTAFRERFGYAEPALPLANAGHITKGNALRLDWNTVCPKGPEDEVYVCGNPPFHGTTDRTEDQQSDMKHVFGKRSLGYLDYVGAWFKKASDYIGGNAEAAFVSTSSLCQGQQVGTLWPLMFDAGVKITFAYQSFAWSNQAGDKAGVHVVVIGLGKEVPPPRRLFTRDQDGWLEQSVRNIGPYLLPGENTVVRSRQAPLINVPEMVRGNQPTDGGNLILAPHERDDLVQRYPEIERWIKQLMGADEFIKGKIRYCLWLEDAPDTIKSIPEIARRLESIHDLRVKAGHPAALKGAKTPHLFLQRTVPRDKPFLIVPSVTSERRFYAPVGFFGSDVIPTNLVHTVPNATRYEFAMLSSRMHMDWLRLVGGRLKSDYRYSAKLVYNTFPWPTCTDAQRKHIESLAEEVLLAREETFEWTMEQMYDPDKMPANLLKAHQALDQAVERLYRDKPFRDTAERQAYLLARYEELTEEEQHLSEIGI